MLISLFSWMLHYFQTTISHSQGLCFCNDSKELYVGQSNHIEYQLLGKVRWKRSWTLLKPEFLKLINISEARGSCLIPKTLLVSILRGRTSIQPICVWKDRDNIVLENKASVQMVSTMWFRRAFEKGEKRGEVAQRHAIYFGWCLFTVQVNNPGQWCIFPKADIAELRSTHWTLHCRSVFSLSQEKQWQTVNQE